MTGEITDKLREIYNNASKEGIWLLEWGPTYGGKGYTAAAGSIKYLEQIEKQTGKEIDISKLTLGDVVDISLPGIGKTREEACQNAVKAFKEYQEEKS